MKVGDVVLGKYRIDRELGRGGMGVVVAATNVELDQQVALKLLLPERRGDDRAIARVMDEARATVQLSGLHTGKVLDVARLPSGEPVLVMSLLDGESLAELLAREGALPEARVVDLMLQACEGLAEAHALEIIHRDIKPSNLFLALDVDGTASLKVIDFGVAKASSNASDLTATQAVVGSVQYMSPEHLRKRPVDARTDIWSLGVVMYELLTARQPFPAESVTDASIQIAVEPPQPMPAAISAKVRAIVERCLEKDPDKRYQTIREVAAALRALGTGKTTAVKAAAAATTAATTPPRKTASRKWPVVALLGAAAAAAAAVVVTSAGRDDGGDDGGGAPTAQEGAAATPPSKPIVSEIPPPTPKFHFAGCTPALPPLPYYRPLQDGTRGNGQYEVVQARKPASPPAAPPSSGSPPPPGTPPPADTPPPSEESPPPARTAGILGSSEETQGGAFASLTGTGDISSGFDDSNIYGGLLGNEPGEMNGGFGFGRSGFGPGGGGTGWGTIGTGRYGTIGHGSGTSSGLRPRRQVRPHRGADGIDRSAERAGRPR